MLQMSEKKPEYIDLSREKIAQLYLADETTVLKDLYNALFISDTQRLEALTMARSITEKARSDQFKKNAFQALMQKYALSSEEGVALMCVAEALLRIPDRDTAMKLISDKIGHRDWTKHMVDEKSFFVNASTWALSLTGKILGGANAEHPPSEGLSSIWSSLVSKTGAPIIKPAVEMVMKLMSKNFVVAETIERALRNGRDYEKKGYTYSFDMLGEGARNWEDADIYFEKYKQAIRVIGKYALTLDAKDAKERPGISVKLSALHPRYEVFKASTCIDEIVSRLFELSMMAKEYGISLCVDAEESYRLDMSLEIIEKVFLNPELAGWEGFGLALQAYQKRAYWVIDYLESLARKAQRRLYVRLVKGAYWDTEIKNAQVRGHSNYPVFTRKSATDLSYLACARKLLGLRQYIYPQFATHNAHTISMVLSMAGSDRDGFEFQKLHGMGDEIYDQLIGQYPCRIYGPVGVQSDLLPYLVRRLLENGANTSFINQLQRKDLEVEDIVKDPIKDQEAHHFARHSQIPLPTHIYQDDRVNSKGILLEDREILKQMMMRINRYARSEYRASSLIKNCRAEGKEIPIFAPFDRGIKIGSVINAKASDVDIAFENASQAYDKWNRESVQYRTQIIKEAGSLIESQAEEIMALLMIEAGKTLRDAHDEVREAIDFCRYYAAQALKDFSQPKILQGPTGEENKLWLEGRGVFVCISPWNFPAAIFVGQIAAALCAGNVVIAKPAEQTNIIAYYITQLFYQAGLDRSYLQLVLGRGEEIGPVLTSHKNVAGVAFTGSVETAQLINKSLAERKGPIVPLIAETGGQNVMVVDSTALPEQVVDDVISSAFLSAGQRCSALRVLLLQADIADKVINMLTEAVGTLKVGSPLEVSTDIGPVIDIQAKESLTAHAQEMKSTTQHLFTVKLSDEAMKGTFVAPQAYEISDLNVLEKEHFGPILHVMRYQADQLDKVIEYVNQLGYGLTFGVHSRVNATADYLVKHIQAGNCYINRNMIGAVVGVQPFGGCKLSGTGPKAGGPYYLHRFATEKVSSNNITAQGGNTTLVMLSAD